MGNSRYIGRVGRLAVALGVGMAIATTPGVAWAEPSDSGSGSRVFCLDSSSTSTTGSTSADEGSSTTSSTGATRDG